MGNRVRVWIHEFTITQKSLDDGRHYLEFIHDRTGYGLNIPVPTFMTPGTTRYNQWALNQFNETVAPLVEKCIEEEARVQQAS